MEGMHAQVWRNITVCVAQQGQHGSTNGRLRIDAAPSGTARFRRVNKPHLQVTSCGGIRREAGKKQLAANQWHLKMTARRQAWSRGWILMWVSKGHHCLARSPLLRGAVAARLAFKALSTRLRGGKNGYAWT